MTMTAVTTPVVSRRSWAEIVRGQSDALPELATDLPSGAVSSADSLLEEATAFEPSQSVVASVATADNVATPVEESVPEEGLQQTWPEVPPGILEAAPPVQAAPTVSAPLASDDVPAAIPALRPGVRGSFQCPCRGEVLTMLNHYGWLRVFGDIGHPLAQKHFGRVYIACKDVVGGQSLQAGDVVSFYLYVDHVGLGAESCQVEAPTKLSAAAVEFVPGGAYTPKPAADANEGVSDMFSRMSRAFSSIPPMSRWQHAYEPTMMFNSSYFGDDDCSDESDDGTADVEEFADVMPTAKPPVLGALATWKAMRADRENLGMTSDSTTAGSTSESESESQVQMMAVRVPPGLRLPPGLENVVPILPVLVA